MWEMTNGHVIKRLEPHDDHDLATPWAELACDDKIVVGLSLDEHSNDEIPTLYKYHVRPTASAGATRASSLKHLGFTCSFVSKVSLKLTGGVRIHEIKCHAMIQAVLAINVKYWLDPRTGVGPELGRAYAQGQ